MIILGTRRFIGGPTGLRLLRRRGGGGDPALAAQIGDEFAGGIYAGQMTYSNGRKFHLVAGKQEIVSNGKYGFTNWGMSGAESPDDGMANQEFVMQKLAAGHNFGVNPPEIFQYCDPLVVGDFSDWYVPAVNELDQIYQNLVVGGHPEFINSPSTWRYTSTASGTYDAHVQRFSDGLKQLSNRTSSTYLVRPVRRIEIFPDYGDGPGMERDGGIYVGTITYGDGRQFEIIVAKAIHEISGDKYGFVNWGLAGAESPYDGMANQQFILQKLANGDNFGVNPPEIFQHCNALSIETFDDWYVPAINELDLIYQNLVTINHAEFVNTVENYRWTSTAIGTSDAHIQRFSDGTKTTTTRSNTGIRLRPIRRIPV